VRKFIIKMGFNIYATTALKKRAAFSVAVDQFVEESKITTLLLYI